jgi:hypothetical protein
MQDNLLMAANFGKTFLAKEVSAPFNNWLKVTDVKYNERAHPIYPIAISELPGALFSLALKLTQLIQRKLS